MQKTILSLFFLSFAITDFAQTPNSLVASYPFNGSPNDASANGVNPTATANIAYGVDRTGAAGKSLYLNNPTDAAGTSYLEFSAVNFQFDGAFSFSVWVNYEGGYVNPSFNQRFRSSYL